MSYKCIYDSLQEWLPFYLKSLTSWPSYKCIQIDYTHTTLITSLSSINIQACKKLEGDLADLEIQAQENDKMKKIVQDHLLREKSKSSF